MEKDFNLFNCLIKKEMKNIGYEVGDIPQSTWTNFLKNDRVEYMISTYAKDREFICVLYNKAYGKIATFKTKE